AAFSWTCRGPPSPHPGATDPHNRWTTTRGSAQGRHTDALTAIKEASGLYRDLAQAHPDTFNPDLAMSLNNLAGILSKLGRREEALTATEEAVDQVYIRRRHP
ncbi:MAG: tetratricopeptide repeat protein, partial [bacterium]|nr:tetratricopeptide repeat protein [bacterium]